MAGQISFALEMQTATAEANMTRASAAFQNLGRSTASAVQPLQSLNATMAQSETLWIAQVGMSQRLQGQLATITNNFNRVGGATATMTNELKAGTASARALGNVMILFGGSVAPQYTAGIMTVTTGFQAMSAAAKAAGVTIGAIAAPVAGAIAVLAGLAYALNTLGDEWGKMQNRINDHQALGDLQYQIPKVLSSLQKAVAERKVSPEEYDKMFAAMTNADNPAKLAELMTQARKMASRGKLNPEIVNARNEANLRLDEMAAASTSDPFEKRRQQANIQAKRDIQELVALAEKANLNSSDLVGPREAQLKAELDQINKEESESKLSGPKNRGAGPISVTSLERIGLVLNGGRNVNDFSRSTADNTRAMLAEQKRTNQILSNPTTNNNFANQ